MKRRLTLRKLCVTAALGATVASVATAYAGFNGFAGLGAGANFYSDTHKYNAAQLNFYQSATTAQNSTGVAGDVFVGSSYRPNNSSFNMSLVADANIQSGSSKLDYTTMETSSGSDAIVKSSGYERMLLSFGLSFDPGLFISKNSEVYLIAGTRLGMFQSHLPADSSSDDSFNNSYTSYNGDLTKWDLGFGGGLGFKTYFTTRLSLDGEYTYTYYLPFNETTTFSRRRSEGRINGESHIKYSPSSNQLMIGMAYNFRKVNFQQPYANPVAWLNGVGLGLPGEPAHNTRTA